MCGCSCRDWNWFFTPLCGFWVSAQFTRLASLGGKHIYLLSCLTSPRQGLAVLCSPGSWIDCLPDSGSQVELVFGFGFHEHLPVSCMYSLCMWRPEVDSRCPPHSPSYVVWYKISHWAGAHWVQPDWLASKSEGPTCLCLSIRIIGTQSVIGKASTWMIRIKHRSLCLHGKHFTIEPYPWYLNCVASYFISH